MPRLARLDAPGILHHVQKGVALGRRPELVDGGLVRNLWGWLEVLALRKRGDKRRSDQRILGDSEFVQDVMSGLDDLVKKPETFGSTD